jgi:curved DNA-binding protein CbpA
VTWPAAGDPFRALGLAAGTGPTDDDVRAAWRRVAAATHPDRADGGDPAAFAAAAAAYTLLRTAAGRGEALADLQSATRPRGRWLRVRVPRPGRAGPRPPSRLGARPGPRRAGELRRLGARIRRGRPAVLALRMAGVGAVSVVAVLAVGWQPASPAIIVGALTWLLRTAGSDLASPP